MKQKSIMDIHPPFLPGKILVTTDLSPTSYAAFPYAASEALSAKTQLEILNVFEEPLLALSLPEYLPDPALVESVRKEARASAKEKLSEIAREHFAALSSSTECLYHVGTAADAIVDHARRNNFGLIVMASHGRGFVARAMIGSVTERVIRHAPCPVLVVPSGDGKAGDRGTCSPWQQIMLTTDLSPASEAALPLAAYERGRIDAHLSVVHVIEHLFAPELLQTKSVLSAREVDESQARYRRGIEERLCNFSESLSSENVKRTVLDKTNSISKTITEYARTIHADLIVIGSHGAGGRLNLIGGVAERVIRHSACPVMVVPHIIE